VNIAGIGSLEIPLGFHLSSIEALPRCSAFVIEGCLAGYQATKFAAFEVPSAAIGVWDLLGRGFPNEPVQAELRAMGEATFVLICAAGGVPCRPASRPAKRAR
jgi:hypothetical protein